MICIELSSFGVCVVVKVILSRPFSPKGRNSLYRGSRPALAPRQALSGRPKPRMGAPPRYAMSGFHNKKDDNDRQQP